MQGVEVAFAFGRLYLSVWINYRDEVPLALMTPVADKPHLVECWPLNAKAIAWPPPKIPVIAAGEKREPEPDN